MHVLSHVTLSSIFHSLALRASMVCIHSLCRGVSGNGDTFAAYEGDGAGDCGPEGVVESGCGVEAIDDGSGMVATRMASPDRDWNSSMSSGACKSVSSTQESCASE